MLEIRCNLSRTHSSFQEDSVDLFEHLFVRQEDLSFSYEGCFGVTVVDEAVLEEFLTLFGDLRQLH